MRQAKSTTGMEAGAVAMEGVVVTGKDGEEGVAKAGCQANKDGDDDCAQEIEESEGSVMQTLRPGTGLGTHDIGTKATPI